MGSLMAGWSSSSHELMIQNMHTKERNHSPTKKLKLTGDQTSPGSPTSFQGTRVNELKGLHRSNSLPVTDRKGNFLNIDSETALQKLMKKSDWWTRSNWAILNEPPVIEAEGPSYKYASQYHITNFGSSKPDTHQGIST